MTKIICVLVYMLAARFILWLSGTFLYFQLSLSYIPHQSLFLYSVMVYPARPSLSLSLYPFLSLCCLVVGVSRCHLISITTVVIHDKRLSAWKRDYSHCRHGNRIVPHCPATRGNCSAGQAPGTLVNFFLITVHTC